jgi:hypothetical protein
MIERRLREQSKPMGFTGSFMQSATTLGDAPEAAKFAVADPTKRQPRKEFLDASAPKRDTTSWDEVKDLATFWEFSKELAGGSAGFIAPAAAAAKAASYLPIVGPYARGIGLATYGLGYLVDQLGTQAQVQQEAIDKGEAYAPTSVSRAAAGAAASTALDVFQLKQFGNVMSKFPFMGKLMGDMGETGAKEAEEQLIDAYLAGTLKPSGAVMKGVAKGLVFEIPQEIAQTAIDRLQSSQALTGEDAMKAYKEAAIGAAILGGPMGGAEGALGYYGAKKKALAGDEAPPAAAPAATPAAPAAPATPGATPLGGPPPPGSPPPPGGLGGPGAGPGAGPGGPGAGPGGGPPPPPPRPFDDDDLNIARDVLLNNKGKKRLTPGGMRYALNAAMRKAGRDGKMARMDEILRHLTIDGFIRPDADGNVTFGYLDPEEQAFDAEGEAEEVTPTSPPSPTQGIGAGEPVPPNPLDVLSAQRASDASLQMPPAPPAAPPPPGTQDGFDFGGTGAGTPPPRGPGPTPQGPQGTAPTQEEFNFGAAAAAQAAAKPDLRTQANEWDKQNRRRQSDSWFEGGKVDDAARAGFDAALQNGGDQLPAHGMSKESTLSGAVQNLLGLLQNGLNPDRRGGRLDYAPLVTARGSAASQVSTTAGGSAYSDGPFILVGRPGQEFEGKLEGLGAILVNQAHADIVPALREAVHAIRPDILVEAYSNAGEVTKQLNQSAAPATTQTATKARETLSLKKKPIAPVAPVAEPATAVAPVAEPVVEEEPILNENEEMTGLDEMDFADAATANLEPEVEQAPLDPMQAVEAANQHSYQLYPGEGVPNRAKRSAFMRGYWAANGNENVSKETKNKPQQKAYDEGYAFAQQQTQNPPQVPGSQGVPDAGRTGASVPQPVPTSTPEPRTTGKGKPAGVDTAGQAASGPATGTPKSKPPLTPADNARIAATQQLVDTLRYLVKTNRITSEEAGRIGATLARARTEANFPYKEEFPTIRKFLMEASNRAGTDNIETDTAEADIDETDDQERNVSRDSNEDEEGDYDDTAYEDESGEPKTLRFSRTADEFWYYSALKRFFETVKQAKATAKQWLGMLSNAPGIKPEEVEWTGIEEYFNLMAAKGDEQITKDEIVTFLDRKGVNVVVTELNFDHKELEKDLVDAGNALQVYSYRMARKYNIPFGSGGSFVSAVTSALNDQETLEYRRLAQDIDDIRKAKYRLQPKWQGFRTDKRGGSNYREFVIKLGDNVFGGQTRYVDGIHYNYPNVLAFIRVDDRIDRNTGLRVLYVNEIQSDWGQDARRWGVKGDYTSLPSEVERLTEVAPNRWVFTVKKHESDDSYNNLDRTIYANSYAEAYDVMVDRISNVLGSGEIEDAPFIKSTEAWTSLALKKLMAIAVNEGYDRIALSNGVQASDRFNKSYSYDTVEFTHDAIASEPDLNGEPTYNITLWDGETPRKFEGVREKDLADVVGDNLVAAEIVEARESLKFPKDYDESGVSNIQPLRVGYRVKAPAKGMVGYYDKIVPKVLKKLAAKLGGTVGKSDFAFIASDEYNEDSRSGQYAKTPYEDDIVTLTVDQKLIDNVQKSVPLFRAAGKGSMLAKDVQGIVDSVIKGWTNAPTVKVVQSIADLPAKLRNSITFGVDGFYADGTVYLIADHLGSAERVQSTLFHESLAHFGLREEFGKKLDPLLDSIYKTNPAMRAAVDKWLKNNPDIYADLSVDEQRRAATEEVFAEQSESGPIKNMGLRAAMNRIVSFIKDFLRQMGFNIAYSDADVANILAKAHDRVISGGKKGVEVGSIRFRRTRVPPGANETAEETIARLQKQLDEAYTADSALAKAIKFRFTQKGFEWLVKRVQNDRRPAKQLEEDLRASGDLIVGDNGFNNLYSLLTLSAQKAFHYMTTRLNIPLMDMKESIREYATANKLDMDAALARLHTYVMALHEHERRMAKYVMNVPLNNFARVAVPGLPDVKTFADHRDFIMKQLYSNPRMSKAQAKQYRTILDAIIAGRYGQAVDVNGVSGMRDARGNSVTGLSLDPMSDDYRVIGGYSQAQFAEFRRQYQAEKPMVDKIIQNMKKVQKETIELNKQANYWSPQVDNLQNFYGWENYVPFKSRKESKIGADDDKLDLSSDRLGVGGYEYLDYAQSFSGRTTDSENPLLQVMMESASAAMRAGRHGITQSVVNLKEQGHLKADKLGTINFEDRYNNTIDIDSYLGNDPDRVKPRIIFHYMPDGKVEIWAIRDKEIAESIRRAYQTPNPIWQATNRVTSFFGHLHTRYNPAFHIYNYIRDSLTNAWLIGTDVSKEARSRYLDHIAQLTVNGGLIKAGKVSRLYANSDMAGIEAMWKNPDGSVKDQFVKDIYDFMRLGGRTAFINALSMQKEGDQLLKELRGTGKLDKVLDARDAGLKWVDIAGDMFELTSRAAAFSAVKSDFRAKGLTEEQANIEAAAFAKGLANFEQVGLWGQKLGAFFMFFRPSATGAVRAVDSLRPLMQTEASYLATVTASAKNTPEKKQKLLADFRRRRQNASDALKMLVAGGAALYVLSMAMAEDDEAERNEVATDDKALWTRNMRLPLKWLGYEGDNPWINIPWGFGFGAFAAGGAQTMALLTGGQSVKEYAGNMVNVGLDSFLPIPVSRINPFDNPGAWFVSSLMPSMLRPVVDFQMNIDSLGRQIYNNRQTKYGDAYTSGTNTPEHINSLARWMADNFDVDIAPNTLNFWASNYFDAISRVIGGAYDTTLAIKGEKDPTIKGMLLPLSSFMGAKSNYDGRKFAEMQEEANDYIAKLNRLENTNPDKLQGFLEENPNAYEIKYIYNRVVNGELRKIAERRKAILSDPNLTPKDRREMALELNTYYNASKRNLMETMKTYGLDY